MKKNIILGAAVMLAAIGSALAANDMFVSPFVHVKFQGQSNFVCVNAGLNCDQNGTNACVVTIPDLSRTTKGYASGCTTQLLTSSTIPVGSYDPAQTIIDADQP